MPAEHCCSNYWTMPRKRPLWFQWEIRIWLRTSRRLKITCARFPMRACPRLRQSRPCSEKSRFMGISPSASSMLPRGEQGSNGLCRLAAEGLNMRKNKLSGFTAVASFAAVAAILISSACSVNVQKEANGQDKQVDIKTLLGGVHVSKQADAADIGLPVYPGARPKEKDSDGSDKSAN